MPDYKELYLTLFRAVEDAVNTLIAAQQKCEELYIRADEDSTQSNPPDNATNEQAGDE